jgi:hypothetical protein
MHGAGPFGKSDAFPRAFAKLFKKHLTISLMKVCRSNVFLAKSTQKGFRRGRGKRRIAFPTLILPTMFAHILRMSLITIDQVLYIGGNKLRPRKHPPSHHFIGDPNPHVGSGPFCSDRPVRPTQSLLLGLQFRVDGYDGSRTTGNSAP